MVSLLLRFHETQVQQLVHFNTNIDDDLYQQDLMIVWSNKLVQTDLSKYLMVQCRKHAISPQLVSSSSVRHVGAIPFI